MPEVPERGHPLTFYRSRGQRLPRKQGEGQQSWNEKDTVFDPVGPGPSLLGRRGPALPPLTSNCGQFMDMPGPWLALNHLRSSTASAALMFCSRSR